MSMRNTYLLVILPTNNALTLIRVVQFLFFSRPASNGIMTLCFLHTECNRTLHLSSLRSLSSLFLHDILVQFL